jgi:hypothetical protein
MSSSKFYHYLRSFLSLNFHIVLEESRGFNLNVTRSLCSMCSVFQLLHTKQVYQSICKLVWTSSHFIVSRI